MAKLIFILHRRADHTREECYEQWAGQPHTSIVAAGDWAMLEWTMSGTHRADLPGMPATGKSFSVRGATALLLDDGRISRNSDYWDMATPLTQLGLMPSPSQERA